MKQPKRYAGIHRDINGGMTDTGKIIRDAWAFGLIPENETCEGWVAAGIENLWQQVSAEWDKYGFRVDNLPHDVRQRYLRIQEAAVNRARKQGWNADRDLEDD